MLYVSYSRRSDTTHVSLRRKFLDDIRIVSSSAQSHQVQALLGHLHKFHSSNYLPAFYLWLPGRLYPLQMVGELGRDGREPSLAVDNAYRDVFGAWNYQT